MARPKKAVSEVLLDLPCKASPDTVREVEHLAIVLERSKSFVVRKMLLRGLSAYGRDGLIDEPAASLKQPVVRKQPRIADLDMEAADRKTKKRAPVS